MDRIGYSLEISGETCTNTALLCRGVDADKNQVGLFNALIHIGGEEQVAASSLADNFLESGLVDGELEIRTVPCINTGLIQVDNGDSDVGALEGDDSTCRTSC